jgi:two-component system cell cycle sensor histidine kinase/response regulator CckA
VSFTEAAERLLEAVAQVYQADGASLRLDSVCRLVGPMDLCIGHGEWSEAERECRWDPRIASLLSLPLLYRRKQIGNLSLAKLDIKNYFEGLIAAELRTFVGYLGPLIASERIRSGEFERLREETRLMFNATAEGIFGMDEQGRVSFVNAAAAAATGYESDELVGQPLHHLVHRMRADGSVYPAEDCPMLASLQDGRVRYLTDEVFCKKDGSRFPVEYVCTPVPTATGRPAAVISFRDISLRRSLEEQLCQSQKMEVIGTLASGFAHDFNNLLTIILGGCEQLRGARSSDAELESALDEIAHAASTAGSLTAQLLGFGRKQAFAPKALDLNRLVETLLPMLRRLLRENIEVRTELEPELGRVEADASRIEQVILNLVTNARDAMPGGGILTIQTSSITGDAGDRRGGKIKLSVSDNGCGMTPAIQAHIFEPFFTTKEVGRGTGLGLSLIFGIVQQSHGDIEVASTPGLGTTFDIYLPRISDRREALGRRSVAAADAGGTETVLVVEDEDSVRQIIVRTLERNGYRVLHTGDPREAVAIGRRYQEAIHLLLADFMMPKLSGVDVAAELRRSRQFIKVLYVSGIPLDPPIGDSFLQKPFTPRDLLVSVRDSLDSPLVADVAHRTVAPAPPVADHPDQLLANPQPEDRVRRAPLSAAAGPDHSNDAA